MRTECCGRGIAALCVIAGVALLAGCAGPRDDGISPGQDSAPTRPPDLSRIPDPVPRAEPRSSRGNPPFYEVMGRRHYVMNDADAARYRERGIASWYGTKFHGRTTSSGEPYDMYAMTAAHKTLPLPVYVRVTHVGNGRSVIVRVNDRGPFIGDRIIDLSYAAAVRLGMHNDGTALVDVEIIEPGTGQARPVVAGAGSQPAPETGPEPVWLQVGAFSDETNATRLKTRLAGAGINHVVLQPEGRPRKRIYRVRIGPLTAVDEIEHMLERVRALGIHDAHILME
ncbi:MAG: septal ring lytic transglycosylase RlpA family protein [Gammaproteobacteria bacterium]